MRGMLADVMLRLSCYLRWSGPLVKVIFHETALRGRRVRRTRQTTGSSSSRRVRSREQVTIPHLHICNWHKADCCLDKCEPWQRLLHCAGQNISPWHDIPLQAKDGLYNFVCEIPKETSAKMEVATVGAAFVAKLPSSSLHASVDGAVGGWQSL